jgi:tyrosine-protein kinase Etk/Wzc
VLASSLTGTDGAMLLVTAVGSRTGTASVTANLAASFALSGRRVIVMSGDLRRPGLVDLLLPEGRTRPDPLDSVPTRVPNLRVVLPLVSPVDPADLLATDSVRERLDDLRASADLLVMDAPPVLVAPDAAILSGYADATVVLAQEGSTTVGQVIDVLDRLRQADGTPAGVVITSDHVRSDVRAEHTVVGDDGPTVRRAAAGDRPEPMTVPTPRP